MRHAQAFTKRLNTDFWNTTSESLHEGGKTVNFTQEKGLGSRENRRGGPLPEDAKDGALSLDRVFIITEEAAGNIWFGLQGAQGYGA